MVNKSQNTDLAMTKLVENIETFKKLVNEKTSYRRTNLLALVDNLKESLVLAPASTKKEYHGAYPGGLIEHSLDVVKTMIALNKAYNSALKPDSVFLVGLFHDIGKCGTGTLEYYLPKNSDWHNKLGIMYEINSSLPNIPVSQRSLFLLQYAGVIMSEDEHYAISSIRDRVRSGEESLPVSNEPMLAIVLQQAIRITCFRNQGKDSLNS